MAFDVTYQLVIDLLQSSDTEKKWEYNETVCRLFIVFKTAYDSINPMASCLNTSRAQLNYVIRFKSLSISVGGIVTSKK
jgi:hypothetical protein